MKFSSFVVFYLLVNRKVSFKALSNLHPISHALANTVKRVVIIISSVLIFKEPLTLVGASGAALAVAGVFAYSLAQHFFKKRNRGIFFFLSTIKNCFRLILKA